MERLIFPVMLGAVVATLVLVSARLGRERRGAFLRESAIVIGAYFVYFLVRGFAEGRVAEAVARAASLEALEERLGLFLELDVQRWTLEHGWLTELANVTYIWGHWPVIGLIGITCT